MRNRSPDKMLIHRRVPVLTIFLAVLTGMGGAGAVETVPASGGLDFTLVRKGDVIGAYRSSFVPRPDGTLEVQVHIDAEVTLGPVRFYHFEYSSIETWSGDRLVGLISDSNDNGEVHHLQAREDGGSLALSVDGKPPVVVVSTSVPSSLWRQSMLREDRPVFDMDDGQPLKIITHCDEKPPETICKITGDIERTLHFGAAGLLVGETLTADDGSEVAYVPQ